MVTQLGIDINKAISEVDMLSRRHGGQFDRGGADSYYRRGYNPHYYTADSIQSDRVEQEDMTDIEIEEYRKGYQENEDDGNFKDWG